VLRRDFAAEDLGKAEALLGRYGTESWHRERVRVRLAALKLASGSLTALDAWIERASADFRDVIAAAEYPGYARLPRPAEIGADALGRVIDTDWRQYQDWLR
jgi:hypothetical protein